MEADDSIDQEVLTLTKNEVMQPGEDAPSTIGSSDVNYTLPSGTMETARKISELAKDRQSISLIQDVLCSGSKGVMASIDLKISADAFLEGMKAAKPISVLKAARP